MSLPKDSDTSFFGRWARRKAEVRASTAEAPAPAPEDAAASAPVPAPDTSPAPPAGEAPAAAPEPESLRLPTLEDLAALSPQSNFSSFMRPGVTQDVKLAALKKMFSDPHHNIMDGLDIYIDDYSKPPALPSSMLKKLASARLLNLVEDEPAQPAAPAPAGRGGEPPEASMLESAASAAPPDADQAQFDFPEPGEPDRDER